MEQITRKRILVKRKTAFNNRLGILYLSTNITGEALRKDGQDGPQG
jgi:hypothetical protein